MRSLAGRGLPGKALDRPRRMQSLNFVRVQPEAPEDRRVVLTEQRAAIHHPARRIRQPRDNAGLQHAPVFGQRIQPTPHRG